MTDDKARDGYFGWKAGQATISQCASCVHKDEDGSTCKAFPDGIPEDILLMKTDHSKPVEGDGGIQYEAEFPDSQPVKSRARGTWLRSMRGFTEGEHPRDPDGKFGAGGGGGGEGDDGGGDGDSGGKYQAAVGKDPEFTKKWNEKLTDIKKEPGPPPGESVIASTNYYTDEGYHKINGALRGTSDEILDQKTIESIQHMDNLCNRKMLDRDIKTFRSDDGAGLPNGGNLSEAQFKKLKGSSFTDRGFTSTATDTSLGDTFGDVKYEYRIPKGSRGAYVDSISKWPDEREFVLGRGTTSTIVDAKIVDGRRTLVLEVQP